MYAIVLGKLQTITKKHIFRVKGTVILVFICIMVPLASPRTISNVDGEVEGDE